MILASKTVDVTFALLTKDSAVADGPATVDTDVLP